jgi:hypothetical protein
MEEKYYNIAELIVMDSLKEQAKHYGVEGLEDAIKRAYQAMPETRDKILATYYKMYGIKK